MYSIIYLRYICHILYFQSFVLYFFGGLECVVLSFADFTFFVFLRDIQTQRVVVEASSRTTNLATHLPTNLASHLPIVSHPSPYS